MFLLIICGVACGAAMFVSAAPQIQRHTTCNDVFGAQRIHAQRKGGDTQPYQQSLLQIYNASPAPGDWTRAHIENELADYFQERGYYDFAEEWDRRLKESLGRSQNAGDESAEYDGFTNLSQFVGSATKPDECGFVGDQWTYVQKYRNQSLPQIKRSLAERENERNRAYSGNLLNPWDDDDPERAAALKQKLERLASQKELLIRDFGSRDPLTRLRAANYLAHVYHYSLSNWASARYVAGYCLKETNPKAPLENKLNYRERLQLLYLLYHAYWEDGDLDNALKAIDYCLEGLAEHRKRIKDEDRSVEYFRNLEDVLSDKTALLLYGKRVLSALAWLEDSKSPILKEIIAGKRKASRTETQLQNQPAESFDDQDDQEEVYSAVTRGVGARKRAPKKSSGNAGNNNDDGPFAARAELIEDESALRLPGGALADGEIALTYFYHEGVARVDNEVQARLYTIVYVAGRKPFALARRVRPGAIEDLVDSFGDQVTGYLDTHDPQATRKAMDALTKLYDGLMRPALAELERRSIKLEEQKLILIPFGETANFPFHALYDRAAGKHLFERFKSIAYTPSLDLYLQGRENRITKCDGILALALSKFENPGAQDLNFTLEEADKIAKHFQRAKLLRDQEATKQQWKQLYPDYPALHFATHALFNRLRPKDSKILLYGDMDDANNLHAADLIDDKFRLDGKLVVLSACETGVQESRPGDDYFGIERYLFAARASAVVSSLWSVNDKATMDFMIEFYREFTSGNGATCRDPSIAWRAAMLRTKEKHSNLFLWAPFKVTGY
jgi:hypothetical protein